MLLRLLISEIVWLRILNGAKRAADNFRSEIGASEIPFRQARRNREIVSCHVCMRMVDCQD